MTIKTFATNENNDLYRGITGNLVVLTGIEAVKQLCNNFSKAQLGEMVLHIDRGIPNFQALWNGTPDIPQFEFALLKTLQSVPGVVRVINISIAVEKNSLVYTAAILTEFGQAFIDGNLRIR